jgi:hypothetical protein
LEIERVVLVVSNKDSSVTVESYVIQVLGEQVSGVSCCVSPFDLDDVVFLEFSGEIVAYVNVTGASSSFSAVDDINGSAVVDFEEHRQLDLESDRSDDGVSV